MTQREWDADKWGPPTIVIYVDAQRYLWNRASSQTLAILRDMRHLYHDIVSEVKKTEQGNYLRLDFPPGELPQYELLDAPACLASLIEIDRYTEANRQGGGHTPLRGKLTEEGKTEYAKLMGLGSFDEIPGI